MMTDRHRVRMGYTGGRPIELVGPVSRGIYRFSGLAREQLVDPRDAVMMIKDPRFRVLGLVEMSPK